MAARIYSQTNGARTALRPAAAIGRWSRDMRAPALRLAPPPAPEMETTAPLPIVAPPVVATEETASRPASLADDVFGARPSPVIQLRPVEPRPFMPFIGRETACPYLECRSRGRRCLSAQPAPVSLERQVRHCLSEDHRQCKYYRKARGLPTIPPNQAAIYTVAVVVLLTIAAVASL